MRDIIIGKLQEILEKHRVWVESGGKKGEKAKLQHADLQHADLQHADLQHADLNEALLRSTNFQQANLFEADFTGADIDEANFTQANLTSARLQGVKHARPPIWKDAILNGTIVDGYLYQTIPDDLKTKYKDTLIIDNTINGDTPKITRSIEFPPEYKQAGISILNYFSEVLKQKYPDQKVKVRIEQEDLKVTMIVETEDGNLEEIEKTLDEYGLVVTGKKSMEEFFEGDPIQAVQLQNELNLAKARIENQQQIINLQSTEIRDSKLRMDTLIDLVGQGLQTAQTVARENSKAAEAVAQAVGHTTHQTQTLVQFFQSQTQSLIDPSNLKLNAAFTIILAKLEELDQSETLVLSEEDTVEFQEQFGKMEQAKPGILHTLVYDVFLKGGVSGVWGNMLTNAGESVFTKLIELLKAMV